MFLLAVGLWALADGGVFGRSDVEGLNLMADAGAAAAASRIPRPWAAWMGSRIHPCGCDGGPTRRDGSQSVLTTLTFVRGRGLAALRAAVEQDSSDAAEWEDCEKVVGREQSREGLKALFRILRTLPSDAVNCTMCVDDGSGVPKADKGCVSNICATDSDTAVCAKCWKKILGACPFCKTSTQAARSRHSVPLQNYVHNVVDPEARAGAARASDVAGAPAAVRQRDGLPEVPPLPPAAVGILEGAAPPDGAASPDVDVDFQWDSPEPGYNPLGPFLWEIPRSDADPHPYGRHPDMFDGSSSGDGGD